MIKIFTAILLAATSFANMQYNEIPSRLQWMHNAGYCGEVSLIAAGLYYGQYLSQYDVRALVGDQINGELLIGINDTQSAQKLHLKYEEWNTSNEENTHQFLIWMKQKIANGNPVVIGLYANQTLFETGQAGDPDYDHIVAVTTLISDHPLTDPTYYGTDQLGFSDHGLWDPEPPPVYYFQYPFDPFQTTRVQANDPKSGVYSLANDGSNYGIAILGVADLNGDTLPCRVDVNENYEKPAIAKDSNTRPAPMPLTLTLTISNLEPHVPYVIYRYNQLDSVPESAFNAHAGQASEQHPFEITTGSTYSVTEKIQSDEVAVYRCVKASAP